MDNYFSSKDILDKAIGTDAYFQIKSILFSLKAADVAEVRHGRWIRQPSEISGLDVEFCSECGQGMNERNQFWNAKYCPHCGARMDEEDEHEAS